MTNDNPAAGTEEFLGRVHEVLIEQLKAAQLKVTPSIAAATATDPGAFLEILARHGLSLAGTEALRAMEAATREAVARTAAELDVHAVVDLLGHTRHVGRLANCAEIPGFVQLTEADGTVRWINHKAVVEVEVVTEVEAEELARPARPAWDSARGRVVDVWDDEGDGHDPPFGDDGDE